MRIILKFKKWVWLQIANSNFFGMDQEKRQKKKGGKSAPCLLCSTVCYFVLRAVKRIMYIGNSKTAITKPIIYYLPFVK